MIRPHPNTLRGGVRVSPYHSDGQWQTYLRGGYMAVYDKYVAPLELSRGDRLVWQYPHSYKGQGYRLSEVRPSLGLNAVAEIVHGLGIELVIYLPKPQASDFQAGSPSFTQLMDMLPHTAGVAFDELFHDLTTPYRAQVDEERKRRAVYGEPGAFTYSPWSQGYPTMENSDHYAQHKAGPTMIRRRHTLMHHEPLNGLPSDDPQVRNDKLRKQLVAFTCDCVAQGYHWVLMAEPMANATPVVKMEHVRP